MTSDVDKALEGLPAFNYPGGVKPRRLSRSAPEESAAVVSDWDRNPTIKKLKGVDTEFFTVGALAEALGLQTVTIRSWERKGWIPKSMYRTPAPPKHPVDGKKPMGRRLYTRSQIEIVIKAAKSSGVSDPEVKRPDWKKFTKIVVDGWKAIR